MAPQCLRVPLSAVSWSCSTLEYSTSRPGAGVPLEYSPECRFVQERTKAFVPLPKEADEQRKALEVLKYRLRSMGGLFREG